MEKIRVRALGAEGQGIADLISGKTLFVEGLLPGEEAEVDIIREKSKIAYGKVVKRITDSPDRIAPPCPRFGECGGCSLMHMNAKLQAEFKQSKVREALVRIGRFEEALLDNITEDIVTPDCNTHYRNHMQYAIDGPVLGLRARSSDRVEQLDECLLEYEEFTAIRRVFENVFGSHPTTMFTGLILRGSRRTKEFMIELISEDKRGHELIIRDSQNYLESNGIQARVEEALGDGVLTGIVLQLCSDKASRRQRSGKRVVLTGVDYFHEILLGKRFRIKAGAFFQVNTEQAEKLYSKVMEYVSDSKIVYDLFCGTGSIGISCVSSDSELYGIEVSNEAVKSAKVNAELNGMKKAVFTAKPAERFDFASEGLPDPDVIIVDPPRKGMDIALTERLKKIAPQKIIYVSCDPATLARDLKQLTSDYKIEKVSTFDLFFWTEHVECVALLQRMSNTREKVITLDVEMEDYHRIVNGGK